METGEMVTMAACHVPGLRWGMSCDRDYTRSRASVAGSVRQPHHAVAQPVEGFAAGEGEVRVLALVDLGDPLMSTIAGIIG